MAVVLKMYKTRLKRLSVSKVQVKSWPEKLQKQIFEPNDKVDMKINK